MKKGVFLMTDGPDGSGNGVIVKSLAEWAETQGLRVFNLVTYQAEHNKLPLYDELKEYDVILSAEPTFSWIGEAVREEIIRKEKGYSYSTISTAWGYGLDREVLYRRLLIPARRDGKFIFQQRGVVTSLVYQPIQAETMGTGALQLDDILHIPGNALALYDHAPDILAITICSGKVCMERLGLREKQDDCQFEKEDFLDRVGREYKASWLKKKFELQGTKVCYIDTNPPSTEEDTKKMAVKILTDYLSRV